MIEAARAGEAGKGFAVVAQEVGKLAAESAANADEIAKVLCKLNEKTDTVLEKSRENLKNSEESQGVLCQVTKDFAKLYESFDEIYDEMEMQATSIDKMSQNYSVVSSNFQDIADINQTQTASTEELLSNVENTFDSIKSIREQIKRINGSAKYLKKLGEEAGEISKEKGRGEDTGIDNQKNTELKNNTPSESNKLVQNKDGAQDNHRLRNNGVKSETCEIEELDMAKQAKLYFEDIKNGETYIIDAEKLESIMKEKDSISIIDIRAKEDFEEGHIKDAKNIPWATVGDSLGKIPKDRDIVVICYSGQSSGQVVGVMRMLGFRAYSLLSGMAGWKGKPIVK